MTTVIANVKDYIGYKQTEKNERAIFKQRYFALHLNKELKIVTLAVHVNAECKNKEMEESEDRIEYKPVSLHHKHWG
jgi:hypothetical protein